MYLDLDVWQMRIDRIWLLWWPGKRSQRTRFWRMSNWELHSFCRLHNNGKYSQYFSTWPFENDKDSQVDFDKYSQCFCTCFFKNDKDSQVEFGALQHLLIAQQRYLQSTFFYLALESAKSSIHLVWRLFVLKGLSSKPSGNYIVAPIFCLLS